MHRGLNIHPQHLEGHVEKPRLGLPVSLIIDDSVPCLNALYYFRLQVNREEYAQHERLIPLDFLKQFVDVCQKWGIRGKFTVLPFPAGLGTILDGWEGCDRGELAAWLELTRQAIAPQFDITPEILTHTLALDLKTHLLIPEAEHLWMANRTQAELAEYMSTAMDLLRQAGFAPTGITQPCFFKGDRPAYDRAVLEAIRLDGGDPAGTVAFYFINFNPDVPPVPPHPVTLLDREKGEAVVSMLAYADDYFWNLQYPDPPGFLQMADELITADGQAGRLVELLRGGAWATFVTHWQSLYSNGSRQGLAGLDAVASRLAHNFGERLLWMTNGEMARYRAAEEACQFTPLGSNAIQIDSAFGCPDFTLPLQSPKNRGPYPKKRVPSTALAEERVSQVEVTTPSGAVQTLAPEPLAGDGLPPKNGGLLSPATWRQVGDRITPSTSGVTPSTSGVTPSTSGVTVCFDLQRGIQVLHLF
jgi:hypothetical protein